MVNECSWMSGICFSFYHSTYCCGDFKRSPPLISLFCQSVPKYRLPKNPASPRGKPRTQKPLDFTIQRGINGALCCVGSGSPNWRPLQGAGETIGSQQPTKYTPSASLCSAAPSEREPRRTSPQREAKSLLRTQEILGKPFHATSFPNTTSVQSILRNRCIFRCSMV